MSTEKDREDAEKISRNEVLPNPRLELEHVDEVMKTWLDYHYKGVLAGIQHARQGERERLVCFAERIRIFLRDYSGVHSYAHEINVVINDFLDQEKSK